MNTLARATGPRNYVLARAFTGAQYTSVAFGERCRHHGIDLSMGSVGDCYDNAMAESFFATLECELLDRVAFASPEHGQREVFSFIEGWYNPHRRHSALGYLSPANYERQYWEQQRDELADLDEKSRGPGIP